MLLTEVSLELPAGIRTCLSLQIQHHQLPHGAAWQRTIRITSTGFGLLKTDDGLTEQCDATVYDSS
jgi:hypothetical protein